MWNYNIPYKNIDSINNIERNNNKRNRERKLIKTNYLILIENLFNKVLNFIKSNDYNFKRYLFLSFGIFILYKLITPYSYEYRTLLLLIFIEFVAIMLSSLSLFLFTHINFINDYKNITTNETKTQNNKLCQSKSTENKTALYILLGFIFLSVHLCIGFSILGIYITQITN